MFVYAVSRFLSSLARYGGRGGGGIRVDEQPTTTTTTMTSTNFMTESLLMMQTPIDSMNADAASSAVTAALVDNNDDDDEDAFDENNLSSSSSSSMVSVSSTAAVAATTSLDASLTIGHCHHHQVHCSIVVTIETADRIQLSPVDIILLSPMSNHLYPYAYISKDDDISTALSTTTDTDDEFLSSLSTTGSDDYADSSADYWYHSNTFLTTAVRNEHNHILHEFDSELLPMNDDDDIQLQQSTCTISSKMNTFRLALGFPEISSDDCDDDSSLCSSVYSTDHHSNDADDDTLVVETVGSIGSVTLDDDECILHQPMLSMSISLISNI